MFPLFVGNRWARQLTIIVLAFSLNLGAPSGQYLDFGVALAWADDDDGGGPSSGNKSGSDGGYRSSSRRRTDARLFRYIQRRLGIRRDYRRNAPRRARAARNHRLRAVPAQPAREIFEPQIIIAAGVQPQQLDTLTAEGFGIVTRDALATGEVFKLRAPDSLSMEAARARVSAIAIASSVDFNHYYSPSQDRRCGGRACLAPTLVGWPEAAQAGKCTGRNTTVGMIDTGINAQHPALAGKNVEVVRLAAKEDRESGKQHGTAIASLLVGGGDVGTPGLLPEARLVAVDAFEGDARSEDRAEAYQLVRALDIMSARNVHVVNMSLSGPANVLLENSVNRLSNANIVLIAAAGNDGPSAAPTYPAAYEKVIAVTAVDRQKKAYRRANRGLHIDLAAPGVGVWTAASVKGTRQKTGTSIAAPFVTAAAAIIRVAEPTQSTAQALQRLTDAAQDLGDPGKDDTYGWGLLDVSSLCR